MRPTLLTMLQHLDAVRNEWFTIGIALNVPFNMLKQIEKLAFYLTDGSKESMVKMIQYWLDSTPSASWEQVASALKHCDQLKLASTINQKYICESAIVTCGMSL